jgi:hypothetical protein
MGAVRSTAPFLKRSSLQTAREQGRAADCVGRRRRGAVYGGCWQGHN